MAKEKALKAATLSELMEPYVGRRYGEDSISTWIRGTNVPPSDALLAAARATRVSIDQFLDADLEVDPDSQGGKDEPDIIVWKELLELPNRVDRVEKSLQEIRGHLEELTEVVETLDHIRSEVTASGVVLAKCVHALIRSEVLQESELHDNSDTETTTRTSTGTDG